MRIICPSCEAAYDIPPTVLTAGRKLRCARCHQDWMPTAQAPPAEPSPEPPPQAASPQPPAPAPLPPVRVPEMPLPRMDMRPGALTAQKPAPGASAALIGAAWLASFALLAALGWGLVYERQAVMQLWPASSWAYRAVGL